VLDPQVDLAAAAALHLGSSVDLSSPGGRHVTSWMDQAMFTAVAAIGLLASTLMLVGAALAGPEHETTALQAVGCIAPIISSVMLMRVEAQILRREAESEG
jgi:ubiquinone biosynthesis protein